MNQNRDDQKTGQQTQKGGQTDTKRDQQTGNPQTGNQQTGNQTRNQDQCGNQDRAGQRGDQDR